MTRLAKEGYFEEEAARKRAPLLHHQYLGQHQAKDLVKPRFELAAVSRHLCLSGWMRAMTALDASTAVNLFFDDRD